MSALKRVLVALCALTLLTGFVAGCGDDDDDDLTVEEESGESDESADVAEDEAMDQVAEGSDAAEGASNPTDEFCAEFMEDSGGDTPIEDVEGSIERASAAQADAADQEVIDALQVLIDVSRYAIENDDGDGVITDAEVQAAAEAFPTLEDAIAVVNTYCGG